MKSPIRNNCVYAHPILACLDYYNISYTITHGAWCGGRKNTYDFRFTDELIETKQYAIVVGKWSSIRSSDTTCIRGDKTYAAHLAYTAKNADVWWAPKDHNDPWSGDEGTTFVKYPRKHAWHLSQFSAYINAYEFTKMVEQLMLVDVDKVVQIQKDDFICEAHDFELLDYFGDKSHEMTVLDDHNISKLERKLEWNIEECDNAYLSGLDNDINDLIIKIDEEYLAHRSRFSHIDHSQIMNHPVIELKGAGGTGKTDYVLRNNLLQRKIYIAQSHKLSRAKALEYELTFDGDEILSEIEDSLRNKSKIKHTVDGRIQVTVWARALHDSPEIWGKIWRYGNNVIFDEVSMMHTKTAQFLMNRFQEQRIYFCGDVGYQLAVYKTNSGDGGTQFDSSVLNIPSYEFTKIFRVKCDELMKIREIGRKMISNNKPIREMEAYYKQHIRCIKSREEVAELYKPYEQIGGKYYSKDMIISSTNEHADEWTTFLKPLQETVSITCNVDMKNDTLFNHFKHNISEKDFIIQKMEFYKTLLKKERVSDDTKKAYEHYKKLSEAITQPSESVSISKDVQLQKWRINDITRDYSNGEIVISDTPPTRKCEIKHAFTAHSTIGETARGKVFIDRRNMFEREHWETIIGRATRLQDIIIIDLPDPTPAEKYAKTKMYCISSYKGDCCYIGHTTGPLDVRIKRHVDDYKNKSNKKCASHKVLKFKDWTVDLIEEWPCASRQEAVHREQHHIRHARNAVNEQTQYEQLPKNAPSKNLSIASSGPYTENRIEYIDGNNLQLLIDKLNQYSIEKTSKLRKFMTKEERELDNIRLFKNYILDLQKKVELNDKGESFINVTYTRKACGGRRYSIGEMSDELGSSKKISHSLQGMYGILRRFLIGKWCHDIDIVNCIPTILIQIAEEDGVPVKFRETLGYYIMNRQECLEEIMEHHGCSKEDAKDAVIRIYNGGTFKKWAEDCCITLNKSEPVTFLEDLKLEIDGMKNHMLALSKYKTIRTACMKLKADKSIDQGASDRSTFATICFKREDEILQAIEESVVNDGWRTETLIYDGLPLYDRQIPIEPSMRRAEEHVLRKTGIHIKLAEKPMYNENLTVDDVLNSIRYK
jgi:hypothetical protein